MSRQQISYFSEYAKKHEIARVETKSHFSEYAKRHEIARVETTDIVLLPEYADNTTARVKDQRCETARLCRQHDR